MFLEWIWVGFIKGDEILWVCVLVFWSMLCLYFEYVVFDFEFSGFVFDFEFSKFVFNFEFFGGKKKPINFLFLKPIAAFFKNAAIGLQLRFSKTQL